MGKVKWGVVGCGFMAKLFIRALMEVEDAEIVAVASRDKQKAIEYAKDSLVQKVYGSYDAIILDPEVDVIYIATPHTEHKTLIKKCIMANKHVICEKPFTLNASDTKEIQKLAKKKNVFVMEAMWTRFLPATKAVNRWIEDERIGKIKYINIRFGFSNVLNINHRLFNPKLGGGALLDLGVYAIAYTNMIVKQKPVEIVSNANIGITDVDETNAIILKYADGTIANISTSITLDLGDQVEIIGTKGRIEIPHFYMASSAYIYDEEYVMLERFHHTFINEGYEYEIYEVNQCILNNLNESLVYPLSCTHDVMTVLDAIRTQWNLRYPQEREHAED